MTTHAQVAARLLRDAAHFFRTVGEQNAPIRDQMQENADVFERVAALVEMDPTGTIRTEGREDEGERGDRQS